MSKLNDAIRPWLLANGFYDFKTLPISVSTFKWDYQYSNGEAYIYFDEGHDYILASYGNNTRHMFNSASADNVIYHFKKHGKAPKQEPEQAYIPLAQQMWDYLLSIGFEEIDNRDGRLGYQTGWRYNLAKGSLCVFGNDLTKNHICLIDKISNNKFISLAYTTIRLNIHSVADLQAWLQDNGYLDDAQINDSRKDIKKQSLEDDIYSTTITNPLYGQWHHSTPPDINSTLLHMKSHILLLQDSSQQWKQRAEIAEQQLQDIRQMLAV